MLSFVTKTEQQPAEQGRVQQHGDDQQQGGEQQQHSMLTMQLGDDQQQGGELHDALERLCDQLPPPSPPPSPQEAQGLLSDVHEHEHALEELAKARASSSSDPPYVARSAAHVYLAGEDGVAEDASCYVGVAIKANWAPHYADSSASREARGWVGKDGEPLATTRMARDIVDAALAKRKGVLLLDACPVNTGQASEGKFLKPDADYHRASCRASAAVMADAIKAGRVAVLWTASREVGKRANLHEQLQKRQLEVTDAMDDIAADLAIVVAHAAEHAGIQVDDETDIAQHLAEAISVAIVADKAGKRALLLETAHLSALMAAGNFRPAMDIGVFAAAVLIAVQRGGPAGGIPDMRALAGKSLASHRARSAANQVARNAAIAEAKTGMGAEDFEARVEELFVRLQHMSEEDRQDLLAAEKNAGVRMTVKWRLAQAKGGAATAAAGNAAVAEAKTEMGAEDFEARVEELFVRLQHMSEEDRQDLLAAEKNAGVRLAVQWRLAQAKGRAAITAARNASIAEAKTEMGTEDFEARVRELFVRLKPMSEEDRQVALSHESDGVRAAVLRRLKSSKAGSMVRSAPVTRETAIAHLQRAADLRVQAHDAHGDEREELLAAADKAQATGERQRAILAARSAGAAGRVEERAPVVLSLDEAAQHLPSSARKAPHALKAFFERARPVSKDDRAIGVALYGIRPSCIQFGLKVIPKGGTPRRLGDRKLDGKSLEPCSAKTLGEITPEQLIKWMAEDQLLYGAQE